jgi:cell division protein FtsA
MNEIIRYQPPMSDVPTRGIKLGRARQGVFGVLDIGSTKVVCLIARIESDGTPRALGFGWQKSRGVKAGSIVDMEEAERSIRAAVASAEQMADTLLKGVIVNLSCGQPESRMHNILWQVGGRAATMADLGAIMTEGVRRTQADGREAVHSFPLGFTVDATGGVDDPRGMVCDTLGARLHVLDASSHALFNLGQCLQRCELEVEELELQMLHQLKPETEHLLFLVL